MRLSRYFLPILRETPEGGGDRLPPPDAARRHDPPGGGRHLCLPAARACACSTRSCRIVREEQDRSGAIELLMPTIQSADLWRESGRYEAYGKEMLRIKDRHERDMLYGPTNEEMITEIFRAYVRSYKDLPLNLYHIQWKFRDEVRPRFGADARARVPDEGRLFVRSRFRRRQARLQPHVRRLSAHLRAHGAAARSRWWRRAGRSAAISRTNSSSSPTPARARCSATATISTSTCPDRTSISTHVAALAGDRRQVDLALCGDFGEARRRRRSQRSPPEQADFGARHRGRPYFLFRHQIFRADEGRGRPAPTASSGRCIWVPTASARAGSSPP